jgi:transposase
MLKVGEVQLIRHMVLNQEKGIRETARELEVSRNTVRKYLKQPEPVRREQARQRPVLGKAQPRIDELLEEWRGRTTPKQRITGARIHRQLIEEGFQIGGTTVREYLREKRRQKAEVFVPLVHWPGDEAQVDFFEVTVELGGQRRKAWKFLMRLMYSGRDFAWLYERCDQVAFLDGHVRAFAHFGAVPRRLVYDNLTAAVKRKAGVLRELTERFQALCSHYCFEPCFARPGEGHDKGGVEGRGKGIRLQHLTPIPRGASLGELSRALQVELDRTAQTKRDVRGETVIERFFRERPKLLPLPASAFEARRLAPASVSRKAQVSIEGVKYSVPSRWAGLSAMAYVGVDDIRVVCRGEEVLHPKARKGSAPQICYRHYLGELAKKPQALRQVAPLLLQELGWPFDLFWQRLQSRMAVLPAARVFSGVLAMVVEHGEQKVAEVLERMLQAGQLDLLTLGAALRQKRSSAELAVPLPLRHYQVESARAADYDRLLKGGGHESN